MAAATSGGKGFKGANTGPGRLKRVWGYVTPEFSGLQEDSTTDDSD